MNKRILIVDDENYIRLLLRRTLEEFEFEGVILDVAEDGLQGLEAARAHKPDLVFLDLMMPHMDGVGLCRALRADEHLRDVYIIILTAKGQLPDFPPDAQPNRCLTKPFDPDQIVDLAQEILDIRLDFD